MEKIFSFTLNVNDKEVEYHVVFENELYVFHPSANEVNAPTFSFKREENHWIDEEKTTTEIREKALDALENYLLSQN